MSVEEILTIIESHPEVIVKALEKKPELLTSFIVKLAPWDRFATKEDVKMLIDFMEKRFEAIDKRFEDLKSYSDKRFEDMNKRFEDLRYYVDKRIGLVEKLLIGFNLPILTGMIIMLIKLFLG